MKTVCQVRAEWCSSEKNTADYLKPVNEAREAVNLKNFTILASEENEQLGKVSALSTIAKDLIEEFLYKLTCKDISRKDNGRTVSSLAVDRWSLPNRIVCPFARLT